MAVFLDSSVSDVGGNHQVREVDAIGVQGKILARQVFPGLGR